MKGGIGLRRKIIDGDRYNNLTSICCVFKEKIVKNDSYQRSIAFMQIQKVAKFESYRKKSF